MPDITDRTLDEQVAQKVMGHDLPEAWADASVGPSHGDPGGYRIGVRPYSSDISAAMEVVDRIRIVFQKEFHLWDFQGVTMHSWSAQFTLPGHAHKAAAATADTPATAICLAALKAVEGNGV